MSSKDQASSSSSSSAGHENQSQQKEELEYLRHQNSLFRGFIRHSLIQGKLKAADIPSELDVQDDTDSVADRETVLEAVRKGTLRWPTLPENSKWKYDAEVVCAVYERDRLDLPLDGDWDDPYDFLRRKESDGLEWAELPFHLKMNREVMLHALRAYCGPELVDLPPRFQTDFLLLSTAILYQKVCLEDIPAEILTSRQDLALFAVQNERLAADECLCLSPEYLKAAIEEGRIMWTMLPNNLRTDLDFAMSISSFYDDKMPVDMLQHCGQIRHQEPFWRMCAAERDVTNLLAQYLPSGFRSNFDFMAEMCATSPGAIQLVGDDLSNHPYFMEQTMLRNGNVIGYLSHPTQQVYRDVIVKTLPNFGVGRKGGHDLDAYSLARALCPTFWSQHDFAMAWVRSGLGFPSCLSRQDERTWIANREICLAHAFKRKEIDFRALFTKDVSFMIDVVENHPPLYSKARGAAKFNPRVMAAAFAESSKMAIRTLTEFHFRGQDEKIKRLVEYLQQELEPYEAFFSGVLGNMLSTQSVQTTGSPLTLLNQGLETSLRYKKLFAEYLDIPTGKRLQRLLRARENVQSAIEPWTPDASIFKRG